MINLFCNCLGFILFMLYVLWNILSLCCGAFIWFQVCYWYMQEFFFNEIMKLKRLMKYIHLWAYLWLYNLYEYELVKVISYNRYLCKVVMACLIFSHWFNEDTFFSGTSLKKQQNMDMKCVFFFFVFSCIYLCIVVALDVFSERTKIDFKIFS